MGYAIGTLIFVVIFICYYSNKKNRFTSQLKQILNVDYREYLTKLFNEIIVFSGCESLSVKVDYIKKDYDACYSKSLNTIFIYPDWVIYHAQTSAESFLEDEVFAITIGHELGHQFYKDGKICPYFSKKNKLISILREFRADNYAKNKCGFSNDKARSVLQQKVKHCHYELNAKPINHPTWQDRIEYIGLYDEYSLDFENEVKAKYADILGISSKELNRITLL